MPYDILLKPCHFILPRCAPQLATLRKCQGYYTPGLIDLEVIRFVRAMAVKKLRSTEAQPGFQTDHRWQ